MQFRCNIDATKMQLKCNIDATPAVFLAFLALKNIESKDQKLNYQIKSYINKTNI